MLDPIGFGGGVKSNGNQQSASTTDATSNQNSSKLSKVGGKSMEHTAIKNEEMANSKTNADSA